MTLTEMIGSLFLLSDLKEGLLFNKTDENNHKVKVVHKKWLN